MVLAVSSCIVTLFRTHVVLISDSCTLGSQTLVVTLVFSYMVLASDSKTLLTMLSRLFARYVVITPLTPVL